MKSLFEVPTYQFEMYQSSEAEVQRDSDKVANLNIFRMFGRHVLSLQSKERVQRLQATG